MKTYIVPIGLLAILSWSCTVTNNMYLNTAEPLQKGGAEVYVTLGSGLEAKRDSSLQDGNYSTTYAAQVAPALSAAVLLGLTDRIGLRAAAHFPYVVGGFGFRLGCQYSFFSEESVFNVAIGTDLGFVLARDSLWGTDLNESVSSILNTDIFLPISVKLAPRVSIILTARYSYTWIGLHDIYDYDEIVRYRLPYPVATLGFRAGNFYFESSALFAPEKIYPQAGVGWIFMF